MKTGYINLVLGEDMQLSQVVSQFQMVLIEHFHGHHLGGKAMRESIEALLVPFLGYSPSFYILSSGWLPLVL